MWHTARMTHDYMQLMWEESADMADLVGGLSEEEWNHDSLCAGWNVKAVISHMVLGHTTPMPQMLGKVMKYGFNVDKASAEMSSQYGAAHSGAELAQQWAAVVANHTRKGISKVIPGKAGFIDHLIHNQDMRRPLGKPRTVPEARLLAALELLPSMGGAIGSKQRLAGLRVVATDVPWTAGDGPEVTGSGEAILMAASGRGAALADLSGPGVATLTSRI